MKIEVVLKNKTVLDYDVEDDKFQFPVEVGRKAYLAVFPANGDVVVFNWDMIESVRTYKAPSKQETLPGVSA